MHACIDSLIGRLALKTHVSQVFLGFKISPSPLTTQSYKICEVFCTLQHAAQVSLLSLRKYCRIIREKPQERSASQGHGARCGDILDRTKRFASAVNKTSLTGARHSSVFLLAQSSNPDPGSPHATRSSCTCVGIQSPKQRTPGAQKPEPKPGKAQPASPARSEAWYPLKLLPNRS